MRIIFFLIVTLIAVSPAFAGVADDLESALLKNDISTARSALSEIQHGSGWGVMRARENVSGYEAVVEAFSELTDFEDSSAAYLKTKEEYQYTGARNHISRVSLILSQHPSFPVSQSVVDRLNERVKALKITAHQIDDLHASIEQQRIAAQKAEEDQKRAAENAERLRKEREDQLAAAEQTEEDRKVQAEEDRRAKLCGKDFRRFYVGMPKKRLLLCVPVTLIGAREGNIELYQVQSGALIKVINGKVHSWIN